MGDRECLRLVLQNAAVVAVRLSGLSPVTATLQCCLGHCHGLSAPSGHADSCITFALHGRPLSPAEVGSAFDPYSGCAGLALLVARSLARSMGGDVWLHVNQDSTRINVRIRLAHPGAVQQQKQEMEDPVPVVEPPPTPALAASTPAPPVLLSARMFRHITAHSDDMFSVSRIDGDAMVYEYVSDSVARWGLNAADMTGKDPRLWMHSGDAERAIGELKAGVAQSEAQGGAPVHFIVLRRELMGDGSYSLLRSNGCITGNRIVAVCRQLRAQEQKEEAMRQLFVSISRELREPAQSGLAAAQLLSQRACVAEDEESVFLARAISASCGLLLGMIGNVLSMRDIEAGTLALHVAPFDPRAAVADLIQVCHLGRAGDISWANEAEPLPSVVEADRSFLCQILQILVTNALKFEDGHGVVVHTCCEAGGGGGDGTTHTLLARVTDHGRGLTSEQCDRMFRAYEAAPPGLGGGSGLGLYISRACARRAGGDVSVVSEPGLGAAFTLRFPVRVPPQAAAEFDAAIAAFRAGGGGTISRSPRSPPPKRVCKSGPETPRGAASPAPPQLRCLLADDAVLNLLLVQRLLQAAGFAVETAVNGSEALAKLKAACEARQPPHCAIIDFQMPHLTGPDVARAFRDWEAACEGAPRLPLFCLTANVLDEHRAEAEAAGFDGFFTKPLLPDAVATLRRRATVQERLLSAAAAPAPRLNTGAKNAARVLP